MEKNMPTFEYKAVSPQGKVVVNKMNDANKLTCIKKLRRNGYEPIYVKPTLSARSKNDIAMKAFTCLSYFIAGQVRLKRMMLNLFACCLWAK